MSFVGKRDDEVPDGSLECCFMHRAPFREKTLRLCVTGSSCGQAQALYQQALLDKQSIYRQWPLLVRAALYDKPYARKVKKYSYWSVGPPSLDAAKSHIVGERKFAFIASRGDVIFSKPVLSFQNYAALARPNACWIRGKRVIYLGNWSFLDDNLYFERFHTGRSQYLWARLPKRAERSTV